MFTKVENTILMRELKPGDWFTMHNDPFMRIAGERYVSLSGNVMHINNDLVQRMSGMFYKIENNKKDLKPGDWFTWGQCVDPLLKLNKVAVNLYGTIYQYDEIPDIITRITVEAKWWIRSN